MLTCVPDMVGRIVIRRVIIIGGEVATTVASAAALPGLHPTRRVWRTSTMRILIGRQLRRWLRVFRMRPRMVRAPVRCRARAVGWAPLRRSMVMRATVNVVHADAGSAETHGSCRRLGWGDEREWMILIDCPCRWALKWLSPVTWS